MNMQMVSILKGEPRTTTLAIAQGTKIKHEAVIKLVRKYTDDLKEFGLLGFEIRPRLKGKHGGGDVEYATLNEEQATLLINHNQGLLFQ